MGNGQHGRSFYKSVYMLLEALQDRTQRKVIIVCFLLLSLMIALGSAGWVLLFLAIVTNAGIWRIVGLAGFLTMSGACWWTLNKQRKGALKRKDENLAMILTVMAFVPIMIGIYGGPHPQRFMGSLGILCFTLEAPVSAYTKKNIQAHRKRED